MSAQNDDPVDVDPAIPLEPDETVDWVGRPRWNVVIPSLLFGLVVVTAGIAAVALADGLIGVLLAVILVPFGLALPALHSVYVRRIQYLVTDRAIYEKRGVLGRAVTQANLETVQNSSYSKDLTGTLFGYGTVAFEIAGGSDITFRAIDDPEAVRSLVDRATQQGDGIVGTTRREHDIPGTPEQWRAVRDEVRSLRRAFEAADGRAVEDDAGRT